MPLEVPRDRNSSFEPKIIPKRQTRFTGLDQKIISMYARGMTTRDIQSHLEEMYQVEVSPSLRSTVTDEVIDEVKAWQNRQLDPLYTIVSGCAASEDERRGACTEQGNLPGDRDQYEREQRSARDVDRANRRGEVLAANRDRA